MFGCAKAGRWRAVDPTGALKDADAAQALSDPAMLAEPRAEAAIRMALFDSLNVKSRRNEGRKIIEPLASSQRLAATDEFRVGAYIRLANLDYAEGNLQAARAQFEKSGITAQQCALVDARPAQVSGSKHSYDFPQEALRWRLSGWTMVELDISPAGIPQNLRTVAAFPPFVFAADAEKKLGAARFQQTYRPGSEQGCVGNQMSVSYKLD